MEQRIQHHKYNGGKLDTGDLKDLKPLLGAYQDERNPNHNYWTDEKLEERARLMLSCKNSSIFGVKNGEVLIGYSVLTGLQKEKAELYETFISPEYRGLRLNAILHDLAIHDVIGREHISRAWMSVASDNTPKIKSAERDGFVFDKEVSDYHGSLTTLFSMNVAAVRAFYHTIGAQDRRGPTPIEQQEVLERHAA